jgi:hypothetical protein
MQTSTIRFWASSCASWQTIFANHPRCLQAVSSSFVQRVQSLVGEVKVDPDASLSDGDE